MALRQLDEEHITVSSTAIGFTAAKIPANVQLATVKLGALKVAGTANDRVIYDASATPTTSVGTPLEVGETILVWGHEDIRRIKFLRITNDAEIYVQYFGVPA